MTQPLNVVGGSGADATPTVGDELRAALAMLTRLPAASARVEGTGVRAYAMVGAALGATAFVPLIALGTQMPAVAAILAVAILAVLSGGLHLDGLADTFDALVAVGPEASERARRDPAIGVAGATTLVLVLGLDVALLAGPLLEAGAIFAGFTCVVAGAVSRSMPAVVAVLAHSAVGETGLGAWFVRRIRGMDVAVVLVSGALIMFGCAFVLGRAELAIGGVVGIVASVAIGTTLVQVHGQVDGDLLGASVELSFATTLLATAVVVAMPR